MWLQVKPEIEKKQFKEKLFLPVEEGFSRRGGRMHLIIMINMN